MMKQWWRRLFLQDAMVEPAVEIDIPALPILERCRMTYQMLDLAPFLQYSIRDGIGKSISVAHPNIDVCIMDVTGHIRDLEAVKHIPQITQAYEHKPKLINRFFIDKEGCYLTSVHDKLVELQTVAIDLVKAIEATKDTDYYSYNMRQLNALLFALYDLGTGLAEISDNIKFRS